MKSKRAVSLALVSSMVVGLFGTAAYAAPVSPYKDGVYTGAATAKPDEDADFDAYGIKVDVTVEEGKVVKVDYSADTVIDSDNETYALRALNGRGNRVGVAAQIIAANGTEGVDVVSGATCTSTAIIEAVNVALAEAAQAEDPGQEEPVAGYVLMNIPYASFYEGEGVEGVDAVSTATVKTFNQNMAAGTYHAGYEAPENIADAKILGITYPVFVENMAVLKGLTQVTDESKATIAVASGKSATTTKDVEGVDVLFASGDYAYYVLGEEPANYKTLAVEGDHFTFSAVKQVATAADGLTATLTYGGHYTNLTLRVADAERITDTTVVNAIVLTTADGEKYALRHVEDIWRKTELGWNYDSLDGRGLAGKTITAVTYYVKGDNGYAIYQYPVSVEVKENPGVMTAAFADETKVTVAGLPADIKNPVATISSRVGRGETPVVIADAVPVVDGAILLAEAPVDGTSYTVKVVSDNYGDASATITYEAPKPQNPLADWAKTAKETGADAADVISAIVTGEVYSAEAMTDEEFITALYQNLFGREPDQGGMVSWMSALNNKLTRKAVLAGLLNSAEFAAKCSELGVTAGTYVSDEIVDANAKITAFVVRLYWICLNREPDQGGLKAWIKVLLDGEATGYTLAKGFFHSQEFVGKNLPDEDFLRIAYRAVLGREAEDGGLTAWSRAMAAGTDRDKVLKGFVGSREFAILCGAYGIQAK